MNFETIAAFQFIPACCHLFCVQFENFISRRHISLANRFTRDMPNDRRVHLPFCYRVINQDCFYFYRFEEEKNIS